MKRIKVKYGYFDSELSAELKFDFAEGFLVEQDLESGYCSWIGLNKEKQPNVHISCIEFI